jgi:hypothetical protein
MLSLAGTVAVSEVPATQEAEAGECLSLEFKVSLGSTLIPFLKNKIN